MSFTLKRTALPLSLLLASQAALAELPGMRGPQHFGFTVPDRQAAVDFFVEVIGCEATISPSTWTTWTMPWPT